MLEFLALCSQDPNTVVVIVCRIVQEEELWRLKLLAQDANIDRVRFKTEDPHDLIGIKAQNLIKVFRNDISLDCLRILRGQRGRASTIEMSLHPGWLS